MIHSFLKEQAVSTLVHERELEISRVDNLLKQLKKIQKTQKEGKFEEELRKIKMRRCERNSHNLEQVSQIKNFDQDALSLFRDASNSFMPQSEYGSFRTLKMRKPSLNRGRGKTNSKSPGEDYM